MKELKIQIEKENHSEGRGELFSVWLGFEQWGEMWMWLADFRSKISAELFAGCFKNEVRDETDKDAILKKFFPSNIANHALRLDGELEE
jgi:hypothetical protein